jgi:hypothetical protein
MNKNDVNLIGSQADWLEDSDGLVLRHTQDISQSFLDGIKETRNQSLNKREGDYMSVAQIPVVVVEKWMREGFDIMGPGITAADIVKRLKAENLDAFLTTDKSV